MYDAQDKHLRNAFFFVFFFLSVSVVVGWMCGCNDGHCCVWCGPPVLALAVGSTYLYVHQRQRAFVVTVLPVYDPMRSRRDVNVRFALVCMKVDVRYGNLALPLALSLVPEHMP